jgi:hypothetical protein
VVPLAMRTISTSEVLELVGVDGSGSALANPITMFSTHAPFRASDQVVDISMSTFEAELAMAPAKFPPATARPVAQQPRPKSLVLHKEANTSLPLPEPGLAGVAIAFTSVLRPDPPLPPPKLYDEKTAHFERLA